MVPFLFSHVLFVFVSPFLYFYFSEQENSRPMNESSDHSSPSFIAWRYHGDNVWPTDHASPKNSRKLMSCMLDYIYIYCTSTCTNPVKTDLSIENKIIFVYSYMLERHRSFLLGLHHRWWMTGPITDSFLCRPWAYPVQAGWSNSIYGHFGLAHRPSVRKRERKKFNEKKTGTVRGMMTLLSYVRWLTTILWHGRSGQTGASAKCYGQLQCEKKVTLTL